MTVFAALAVLLLLAVLALLLRPLFRPEDRALKQGGGAKSADANLAILQEQKRQLEAERASGQLSAEQYAAAHMELARRTLLEQPGDAQISRTHDSRDSRTSPAPAASRRTAWVLASVLPLLALTLYMRVGTPEAVDPSARLADAGGAEVSAAQVEAMLATMSAQLEKMPPGQGDPAGWEMLGRTLASLQRYEEADRAYARAITLAPPNAQLLADRADLLMLLQGRSKGLAAASGPSTADEAQRLIIQALEIDPDNLKALALAGSAAFEAQNFETALQFWTRARQLVPGGSSFAQGLDESLAAARSSLGQTQSQPRSEPQLQPFSMAALAPGAKPASAQPVIAAPAQQMLAPSKGSVSGNVRLAPALQARLGPTDTLYIFARVAGGPDGAAPRMPVAILRLQAKDLPLDFKLDDSLAMSADFKLSGQKTVLLQARVSRSGQAMPQSGDLIGQAGPVPVGASGVALFIDAVQP